jgi:hypothetical protein
MSELALDHRDPRGQDSPNCDLEWRRDGAGWILLHKRRRMGRVIPDSNRPGMWRAVKSRGEYSGIANLSWAKNAVLVVAELELEFEHRQRRANDPQKCPVNGGLFRPQRRWCLKTGGPQGDPRNIPLALLRPRRKQRRGVVTANNQSYGPLNAGRK